MPSYLKGCLIRTQTASRDIGANDFRLFGRAPVANGPNWDLTFDLSTAQVGDVQSFVQATTSVEMFTDADAPTPSPPPTYAQSALPMHPAKRKE